jgi:hypothetical protein
MVCWCALSHTDMVVYICWWTLSHTNSSTVGDGRNPSSLLAHYTEVYIARREKEEAPPTTIVGIPPSRTHMKVTQGATTDRKSHTHYTDKISLIHL